MSAHKVFLTIGIVSTFLAHISLNAAYEMRSVPGGIFEMGDTQGTGNADERPVHYITLSSFQIDRCEISKAQWDEVRSWAATNGYTDLAEGWGGASYGPTRLYYTNHPVVDVSWYDCVKWCNARSEKEGRTPTYYTTAALSTVYKTGNLNISNNCVKWTADGYRLPTEAEWERACRGGILSNVYPWGANLTGDKANYWNSGDPYDNGTTPLAYYNGAQVPSGTLMTNGYGLYDVIGNVQEWCWDWYVGTWYSAVASTNPNTHGPLSGTHRILRGGCWDNDPVNGRRCAWRNQTPPDYPYCNTGFRAVMYDDICSLAITSTSQVVAYGTTALALSGTNHACVGSLWISNAASSLAYSFSAELAWTSPEIALEVGANAIGVYGTNEFGALAQDSVVITRKAATPTGLAASDGTFTGKVALAWLAAPGAASYRILRAATNDSASATTIANAVSNTVCDDTSATPGLLYYYWVIAQQNGVEGDASAPDTGYRQLAASSSIVATLGYYTNNVVVSWAAVEGATKYRVYRADSALTNIAGVIGSDITDTNYTDSTVTPGLIYYYWVQAQSAVAASAWSATTPGYALLAANFADKKTWTMRDTKKYDTLTCKNLPGPWGELLAAGWSVGIVDALTHTVVNGPFQLVTKNGRVWTLKSPTTTITYTQNYNKRKDTYKVKLVYKFLGNMPAKPGIYLQPPAGN